MNPLEQVALAGQALWHTVREVRSGRLWIPWLWLGVLELLTLLGLVWFAHPLLAWALAPLVRAGAGEAGLHYPDFFRALPSLYARADLVVVALGGAVAAGWSTAAFAARWRGVDRPAGGAWAEAAPRALTLVLVQLPFNVLAVLLVAALSRALAGQPGLVQRLGGLVGTVGVVGLQAVFLYLPALVVLERRGPWQAFAALPRSWARGFWAAVVLGALALLPLLPFDAASAHCGLLVDRGRPELVAGLVALQLLAGLAVSFLLAGSSTLVYLGAVADEPGAGA